MRKLILLIIPLLVAGCSTVQYPPPVGERGYPPPIEKQPTIKTKVVQFGSKFQVYPYEPDYYDLIELQESENKEVPFTFFKLQF